MAFSMQKTDHKQFGIGQRDVDAIASVLALDVNETSGSLRLDILKLHIDSLRNQFSVVEQLASAEKWEPLSSASNRNELRVAHAAIDHLCEVANFRLDDRHLQQNKMLPLEAISEIVASHAASLQIKIETGAEISDTDWDVYEAVKALYERDANNEPIALAYLGLNHVIEQHPRADIASRLADIAPAKLLTPQVVCAATDTVLNFMQNHFSELHDTLNSSESPEAHAAAMEAARHLAGANIWIQLRRHMIENSSYLVDLLAQDSQSLIQSCNKLNRLNGKAQDVQASDPWEGLSSIVGQQALEMAAAIGKSPLLHTQKQVMVAVRGLHDDHVGALGADSRLHAAYLALQVLAPESKDTPKKKPAAPAP